MRPNIVVVHAPGLDEHACLFAISKPFELQAFFAKSAIEALVHAVLSWLARVDLGTIDLLGDKPSKDGTRNELRAVVGAEAAGCTMNTHELCKKLDHARRANPTGDIDGERFSRPLVDHS